jgi:16S rRNA (guanine966-N2)-methyltransferase
VRVVAGEARGRRLRAKLPDHVRPTTDFVREAVFALLHTRFDLHGAVVWDLYCGSGAMGIEALSRGAVHLRRRRRGLRRRGEAEPR